MSTDFSREAFEADRDRYQSEIDQLLDQGYTENDFLVRIPRRRLMVVERYLDRLDRDLMSSKDGRRYGPTADDPGWDQLHADLTEEPRKTLRNSLIQRDVPPHVKACQECQRLIQDPNVILTRI